MYCQRRSKKGEKSHINYTKIKLITKTTTYREREIKGAYAIDIRKLSYIANTATH